MKTAAFIRVINKCGDLDLCRKSFARLYSTVDSVAWRTAAPLTHDFVYVGLSLEKVADEVTLNL